MNIQDIIIRRRLFRKEKLLPGLLFHSDDPANTLKFINKTDNTTGKSKAINLMYSVDNGATWTTFNIAQDTASVTLPVSSTDILLRGVNTSGLSPLSANVNPAWDDMLGSFHIQPTKATSVRGNVQWIIDCNNPTSTTPPPADMNTLQGGSLCGLFRDAVNIVDIDELVVPYTQPSYQLCQCMFIGCNGLTRIPRTLFAFLNNTECTYLNPRTFAFTFAACFNVDYCDLTFYNVKEIGWECFSNAFAGCPFRTHLVYDAMKNIEKGDGHCFTSTFGAGWIMGQPDKQVCPRAYDMPRIYGTVGTIRTSASTEGFLAQTYSGMAACTYIKNLNDYINSDASSVQTNLPFYGHTQQIRNGSGIFVKYWLSSWKYNNMTMESRESNVPKGWTVLNCKPFYETASGVDEYCIATGPNDTTWHTDKLCDEYGNLI